MLIYFVFDLQELNTPEINTADASATKAPAAAPAILISSSRVVESQK